VTEHEVPAETGEERHGPLEVHRIPGLEGAEGAASARLLAQVEPEAFLAALDHRETHPVHGDGTSDRAVDRRHP
jgi:hypothetical protein